MIDFTWAEEMAQWLSALAAFSKDTGSSISIDMATHNHLQLQSQRSNTLSDLQEYHIVHRHMCRKNTHTHRINKSKK